MEPFAGELVADSMTEAGTDVRLHASITKVVREGGVVTATLDDGSTVEADEILVATGRTPNTKGLGLASVGLPDGDWLPPTTPCSSTPRRTPTTRGSTPRAT